MSADGLVDAVALALGDAAAADLTLSSANGGVAVAPLRVEVAFNEGLEAAARALCTAPALFGVELNVFIAQSGQVPRYVGSNAAGVLGAPDGALVVRGPGAVDGGDTELVVIVAPTRVAVLRSADRVVLWEGTPSAVAAVARGDARMGVALFGPGAKVATWTAARELDLATGRWKATSGSPSRIAALLAECGVADVPKDIARVSDDAMAVVAPLLCAVDEAAWTAAERLAAHARLGAIDRLAVAWPGPTAADPRQTLEYARLFFRIQAEGPASCVTTLRAAAPKVWPRLYQEDQPGHEPNLFALTGQHDRAAYAYARMLAAPPPDRSGVWFHRVAMDLATAFLHQGQHEAALDAAALATLHSFGDVDGWVALARFHAARGDLPRASAWAGLALLRADAPRGRPCSLAGMVDAQRTPDTVANALAEPAFAPVLAAATSPQGGLQAAALYRDVKRVMQRNLATAASRAMQRRDLLALKRQPAIEWSWAAGPLVLACIAHGEPIEGLLDGDDGIAPPAARACAAAAKRDGDGGAAKTWRARAARVEAPPWLP